MITWQERYRRYCLAKWKDGSFYKEIDISKIETPFTILLGPNGCGKSMSIRLMQQTLDSQKKKYLAYSNKNNDVVIHDSYFDPTLIAYAFTSEGERIKGSIDHWNNGKFLKAILKDDKDLFIFLDEFDSGLSFDKLKWVINTYIWIYEQEKIKHPKRKLTFILTCNSWEMLRCFKDYMSITKTIWVPTATEVWISDYEQFEGMYDYYFRYMEKKITEQTLGGKNERE